MARLFTAGGTDNLSWGSDTKLDNLAQASFTAWAVLRRDTASGNLWIADKSGALTTAGWQWLIDEYNGGGAFGHQRLILGRSTAFSDIYCGSASGNDVIPEDVHYFVAVVWNGSAATFYLSPFETPVVAATTANTVAAAGSGTFGADATANLIVGNSTSGGGTLEFGGDIDFMGLHNVALTRAQLRQIQLGCLAYNAGDTTRGAAMITGVSGCVLAGKLNSGGTATDLSASPATGTFTGTDAGTALGNIYIWGATGFGDNLYRYSTASAHDQVTHFQASGYARTGLLTTTAAAGTLWIKRSMRVDEAVSAKIGLRVNGTYTDTLTTSTIDELSADTFSGLGGASKTLEFICGPRSRPGALPAEGTWPILVILDQSATQAAPVEGTSRLHYISESTLEGFFCDPPAQYAPAIEFRNNLPTGFDGIASFAYGGMQGVDVAGTGPLLADTVATLITGNPKAIILGFGVNDKVQDVPLTTLLGYKEDLIDALLAEGSFTGKIYLLGPLITTSYEGNNTAAIPYDLDDVRDGFDTLAASYASARVISQSMKTWVTTGQLDADGVHLNNTSGPIVGQELADLVGDSFNPAWARASNHIIGVAA